jgi:hypothetical protein
MWMNQYEIEEARERFARHAVLGPAARFLDAFKDEVNAHSNGWAYWQAPAKAAEKLMTLIQSHLHAGMGCYPVPPVPTAREVEKALVPIRGFYTCKGYKAGMKMPDVREVTK